MYLFSSGSEIPQILPENSNRSGGMPLSSPVTPAPIAPVVNLGVQEKSQTGATFFPPVDKVNIIGHNFCCLLLLEIYYFFSQMLHKQNKRIQFK